MKLISIEISNFSVKPKQRLRNRFLCWATALSSSISISFAGQDIESLIRLLTLHEKIGIITGGLEMETHGVSRLGIPALKMTDGPLGVLFSKATAFPAGFG